MVWHDKARFLLIVMMLLPFAHVSAKSSDENMKKVERVLAQASGFLGREAPPGDDATDEDTIAAMQLIKENKEEAHKEGEENEGQTHEEPSHTEDDAEADKGGADDIARPDQAEAGQPSKNDEDSEAKLKVEESNRAKRVEAFRDQLRQFEKTYSWDEALKDSLSKYVDKVKDVARISREMKETAENEKEEMKTIHFKHIDNVLRKAEMQATQEELEDLGARSLPQSDALASVERPALTRKNELRQLPGLQGEASDEVVEKKPLGTRLKNMVKKLMFWRK